MKSSTADLRAALYNYAGQRAADCYRIALPAGTLYLTSGDAQVTITPNTYQPAGIISRARSRISSNDEVATMDLDLVPGTLQTGGVGLTEAARRGAFDDAVVEVRRVVDPATYGDSAKGTLCVFYGIVDEVEPDSEQISLVVKSVASLFQEALPRRLIQPQCPFNVYDSDCGVNPASFTHARTAAAGSSATQVVLSSASSNAIVGSWVTFTSGALAGATRIVTAVSPAAPNATTLTLDVPLPAAPQVGDGVSVKKGCAKNRTACSGFSNILRHGGLPEAVHEDS
jgi:hypothetical protein